MLYVFDATKLAETMTLVGGPFDGLTGTWEVGMKRLIKAKIPDDVETSFIEYHTYQRAGSTEYFWWEYLGCSKDRVFGLRQST